MKEREGLFLGVKIMPPIRVHELRDELISPDPSLILSCSHPLMGRSFRINAPWVVTVARPAEPILQVPVKPTGSGGSFFR
jgi:hypothetical protein